MHRVLVADPPWRFGDKLPGPGRGAEKHYPTLSLPDLCNFQIPAMHADAVLLLWRVASMQQEALDVVRAWGFTVKSEMVWLKRTATGRRWFGMGRQVRMEHETCLIATRGRNLTLVRDVRSTFEAPAGRHSAKPDAFFNIIERLYPGPYAELFARRVRPGWTCIGNEIPNGMVEAA
jgi:N6-adenosine-specific RNA methylase IME4